MLGKILSRIVDFFIPHQCMSCGKVVSAHGVLCEDCFCQMDFISDNNICRVCGGKIEFSYKPDEICAKCLYEPPIWGKVRAAIYYDYFSKKLVLGLKYTDRTEFTDVFAMWMVRAYGDMGGIDLIVPVPLHRRRLFFRKYNQAMLLAREISKQTGIPFCAFALKKTRHTKVQGLFNARGRKANVRGVFTVTDPGKIEGKTVLIVDDVLTTGATVSECARVLLDAGAREVNVLTLCRT